MKIGDYAWMQKTGGRLSFKEKLKLIHQTLLPMRANLSHVDDISYTLVPPK